MRIRRQALSNEGIDWLATTSGLAVVPAGLPGLAALGIEFNFPYDSDWTYPLYLIYAIVGQWAVVWLLGRIWAKGPLTWKWMLPLWAIVPVCMIAGFYHLIFLVARHS